MSAETMEVRWPKKFGQRIVRINTADFDPAIHVLPGEVAPVAAPAVPVAHAAVDTTHSYSERRKRT